MEKEIIKLAGDFAAAELAPRTEALDCRDTALLHGLLDKAAENGFFSFLVPETSGGSGLGMREYLVLVEELAKSCPSVAVVFAAHCLGTAPLLASPGNQKSARLLEEIPASEASGKSPLFTLAVRENKSRTPIPGKLGTGIRTEGGKCTISGTMTGVLCAEAAANIVVAGNSERGRALVTVPTGLEGIEIKEDRAKLGLRLCPINDVVFNNVEVPAENIVEENVSAGRILEFYNSAGPILGAAALGIMKKAYGTALKYSTERYQGGKIICEHDAIKIILGDMLASIRTTESLLRDEKAGMAASTFPADAAEETCLNAIQVLGGYGYMKDFEVERFLRDAKTLKSIINPAAWKMKYIEDEIENNR